MEKGQRRQRGQTHRRKKRAQGRRGAQTHMRHYAIRKPPIPKLHAVSRRFRMISSVEYSGSSIWEGSKGRWGGGSGGKRGDKTHRRGR